MTVGLDAEQSLENADPFTRLALLCKVLAIRPMSPEAAIGEMRLRDIDYLYGEPEELPNMLAWASDTPLQSLRVALRAPEPDDVDAIYRVVNDPTIGWRLPSRGRYVSPEQVVESLINESAQLSVAYEVSTGRAVTLLGLSEISEFNRVGELSFFSLRNSSHAAGVESVEALACFVSHCFRTLGLRKLTAAIPHSNYDLFESLEGIVFEKEGTLRDQVMIAGKYEDLILIAVFADTWSKVEPVLRLAFQNWQL